MSCRGMIYIAVPTRNDSQCSSNTYKDFGLLRRGYNMRIIQACETLHIENLQCIPSHSSGPWLSPMHFWFRLWLVDLDISLSPATPMPGVGTLLWMSRECLDVFICWFWISSSLLKLASLSFIQTQCCWFLWLLLVACCLFLGYWHCVWRFVRLKFIYITCSPPFGRVRYFIHKVIEYVMCTYTHGWCYSEDSVLRLLLTLVGRKCRM